jgi:pentatricopeptide repeat protein
MVIYRADWDFATAEEHYRRAIEINDGYATVHHQYAMLLATWNRTDEALDEIRIAQELDPLSLIISTAKGLILHFARCFDEAIEQCRQTLALDPEFVPAFFDLCVAYSEAGRFDEALDVLTRMDELDRDPLRTDVMMARYLGMTGEREKAKRLLDKLLTKRGEQHVSPITLAVVYLGLGDIDNAMREVEAAYEQRDPLTVYVRCEPSFDALRELPEFQALVETIGVGSSAGATRPA